MTRFAARVFVVGILIASVSVLSAACSGTTTAASTAPTPTATTETFSGTLPQLGSVNFPFTIATSGNVTATLTDVEPLTTLAIGVSIGTWDGTNCTPLAKNDNSRSGTTALSGVAAVGSYCMQVYDSGNIQPDSTVTFTLQVVHF